MGRRASELQPRGPRPRATNLTRMALITALIAAISACSTGNPQSAAESGRPDAPPSVRPAPRAAPTRDANADPSSPPSAGGSGTTTTCTPQAGRGTSRLAFASEGTPREYLLTVPPPTGDLMPVVLSLHGYGQDAAQQDSYTGLPAAAQASGVLLVTPEGAGHRWNFVRSGGGPRRRVVPE